MPRSPAAAWSRATPAPFAADPAASRGRVHDEPPATRRGPFQRDRDRIVHSTAFRRLRGKTQVFLTDESDHFRTRLTHTLEVAQVARSLARALAVDEDLTEAVALAHDLGHPPFGHAGERALDRAMAGRGGFDHNAQSLRIVACLERRYPAYDGLNLSWEVLEGLAKHNGPLTGPDAVAGAAVRATLASFPGLDLRLDTFPSLEAQLASVADDIAYDAHDLDDGIRAGLVTLSDLAEVAVLASLCDEVAADYPRLDPSRTANEVVRRLIGLLVDDVIDETGRRLKEVRPASAEDVRLAGRPLAAFSPALAEADRAIKAFLFQRVYRDERVLGVMRRAEAAVTELFARYDADPKALPPEWRGPAGEGAAARGRRIADFLAGMTDRFAAREYSRLFDRLLDFG